MLTSALTPCPPCAGLSPDAVQSVILRALECLPSEERRELLLKLAGAEAVDAQEQNELLMSLLRFLCDEKQRSHTHVTAGQPPARWGREGRFPCGYVFFAGGFPHRAHSGTLYRNG